MEKLFAITLCLLLTLSLCSACTKPPENASETTTDKQTTAAATDIPTIEAVTSLESTTQESSTNPALDCTYEENEDGGITITEWLAQDDHIDVPAQIEGKPVTVIGAYAFVYVRPTSVSIPSSVKVINAQAFWKCNNLKTVELSEGLEEIWGNAFEDCTALESITLPDSLKVLGNQTFMNCTKLKHINIPAGLTYTGWEAFSSSGLETVDIEEGVEELAEMFFYRTNLREVILPNSMKSIAIGAFSECKQLTKIVLNEGLITIDQQAFSSTAISEIVIPSTVVTVTELEFFNCVNLKKVYFEGNAPENYENYNEFLDKETNGDYPTYIVYYHADAQGFTSPEWNGYATLTW